MIAKGKKNKGGKREIAIFISDKHFNYLGPEKTKRSTYLTPLCLLSLADPRIQSNNRYLKINNKIIPQEFLFILLFPPFFSATKQSFNQNHCSKIKIKLQKHNFKKKKGKKREYSFIYSFLKPLDGAAAVFIGAGSLRVSKAGTMVGTEELLRLGS